MVKNFVKILLGAFALFMVLSIVQEWNFFASAWFGKAESGWQPTEVEAKAMADTLGLYQRLASHLYGSGGDPRFADRIPAAPHLVDEMLGDIEYVKRNHRVQRPELIRMEVLSSEPLRANAVEFRTREYWVTSFFWLTGEESGDPPVSQVLHMKYLITREGQAWQVAGWDCDEPAADSVEAEP
jgi:hypothetical protein